jgi:alkanesulfonate monooxygenase SsuD/methylene tetrahydromethanopterin reductase-like flavin-dependent oxidoreductase (luciferase family)
MQFGLFTLFDFFPDRQNEVVYYQDTLDFVIHAEKLGFDSVWMGEEHFYSFGICPSPQLFLTALARETTRMRLGPPSVSCRLKTRSVKPRTLPCSTF